MPAGYPRVKGPLGPLGLLNALGFPVDTAEELEEGFSILGRIACAFISLCFPRI